MALDSLNDQPRIAAVLDPEECKPFEAKASAEGAPKLSTAAAVGARLTTTEADHKRILEPTFAAHTTDAMPVSIAVAGNGEAG